MERSKTTKRVSNAAYVTIIVAIVLVVNLLGDNFFGRLDLTGNKLYSISPVTGELLGELDDVVMIKGYFSEKLPVQLSRLPGEIDDMLEEYRIFSGGNINYERLDPSDDENLKEQLASVGVMPVTMTIIEKDERQQINGYLAITVTYGEQTETIPVVQNTEDLEYELTSRIYRVTHQPARIGFMSSHTRHDLMGDYSTVANEIRKIHDIQPVDLSDTTRVLDNLNALIVAGPDDSLSEQARFAIDQFLMRGGKVMFMIDNLTIGPNRQPLLINHGLGGQLQTYGIRLAGGIIRDNKSHSPERISQGIFTYNQPNPFFPRITGEQYGEHPLVRRLGQMTLPWCDDLERIARDSTAEYTVLATTSSEGELLVPPTFQAEIFKKERAVAMLAVGSFQSHFQSRPDLAAEGDSLLKYSTDDATIIVVGCSSFLQGQYLYQGNIEFMLNAVDYLTIGDRLISIRTRPTTDRPLKEISPEMKNFMRIVNIVGVPIFVILFGAMRFYLRRRDKAVRSRSL
ncbi:MAG: hypothetical protein FVQ81_08845 [Candidatus Glassbacteria bacterium]|nr:hypothetical protein [Candidatus Glassbacteria bacterium]